MMPQPNIRCGSQKTEHGKHMHKDLRNSNEAPGEKKIFWSQPAAAITQYKGLPRTGCSAWRHLPICEGDPKPNANASDRKGDEEAHAFGVVELHIGARCMSNPHADWDGTLPFL